MRSRARRHSPRGPASGPFTRVLAAGLAIVALGLGGLSLWRSAQEPPSDGPRLEFVVDGLDCPLWCAVRLCDGIDEPGGACVERLDASRGTLVVRYAPGVVDAAGLQRRIEARGFRVVGSSPVDR